MLGGEALPEDGAGDYDVESADTENIEDTVKRQLRRREDWNREGFKQRVMGNMEIVQTIAELYLSNAPGMIGDIDTALGEGDFRALRNGAHDLKGMSENLGAEKVALLAHEIELAALDRRVEDMNYLVNELHRNYLRVEQRLQDESASIS